MLIVQSECYNKISMQINTISADLGFEKAERYLPVRLSTTYFDEIGECMCIVANRADGMTTKIIENDESEVFVAPMDQQLYNEIKFKVLNMDYWIPNTWYNTLDGYADGKWRKIHMECAMF